MENMTHTKSSKENVSLDVERMKTARNMPRYVIPQCLTGEQIREHILAAAKRAEANLGTHEG